MTIDERLRASGVKYRCACGEESEYQREAKLPDGWSIRFVMHDERSWLQYICAKCVVLPAWRESDKPADATEARLEQLRNEAATKPRGRKKR